MAAEALEYQFCAVSVHPLETIMSPSYLNAVGKVRRIIKSPACTSVVAIIGAVWFVIGTQYAVGRELPLASIVNGHRLQPREDELRGLGAPDVTASEGAEIDRLYQELMHCRTSQCANGDLDGQSAPSQPRISTSGRRQETFGRNAQGIDNVYRELISRPPYMCPAGNDETQGAAC